MDGIYDFYLDIGDKKIVINPSNISKREADKLNRKITQARIKNSAYGKLPPKEGETKPEYDKRYAEWAKEQDAKLKDETMEEFTQRMYSSIAYEDNMNYMYDVLCAIAEAYDQGFKVTPEAFLDVPLGQANNFIVRVLNKAKIPIEFVLEE